MILKTAVQRTYAVTNQSLPPIHLHVHLRDMRFVLHKCFTYGETAKQLSTCPGQYHTAIRVSNRNQEHLNFIFTEVSPGLNLKNSILNLFNPLETKGRYQVCTTSV